MYGIHSCPQNSNKVEWDMSIVLCNMANGRMAIVSCINTSPRNCTKNAYFGKLSCSNFRYHNLRFKCSKYENTRMNKQTTHCRCDSNINQFLLHYRYFRFLLCANVQNCDRRVRSICILSLFILCRNFYTQMAQHGFEIIFRLEFIRYTETIISQKNFFPEMCLCRMWITKFLKKCNLPILQQNQFHRKCTIW